MKLAKSILCGVAALGMTAGAAVAQEEVSSASASNSESYYFLAEPVMVYEETYVLADPSSDGQVAWSDSPSYDVIILEQGDTRAYGQIDADPDYSSVD